MRSLWGDKLGLARSGEVKPVEGVMDENEVIVDVGWVQGFKEDGLEAGRKVVWSRKAGCRNRVEQMHLEAEES